MIFIVLLAYVRRLEFLPKRRSTRDNISSRSLAFFAVSCPRNENKIHVYAGVGDERTKGELLFYSGHVFMFSEQRLVFLREGQHADSDWLTF